MTGSDASANPARECAVRDRLELAHHCSRLLVEIVDIPGEIFASLYADLADHAAIAEEHIPSRGPLGHEQRLTATMLASAAKALRVGHEGA
jgi:hypothetical protein